MHPVWFEHLKSVPIWFLLSHICLLASPRLPAWPHSLATQPQLASNHCRSSSTSRQCWTVGALSQRNRHQVHLPQSPKLVRTPPPAGTCPQPPFTGSRGCSGMLTAWPPTPTFPAPYFPLVCVYMQTCMNPCTHGITTNPPGCFCQQPIGVLLPVDCKNLSPSSQQVLNLKRPENKAVGLIQGPQS